MYYLVKEIPGHIPVKIDEDLCIEKLKQRMLERFRNDYSEEEIKTKTILYDAEAGYYISNEYIFATPPYSLLKSNLK